MKARKIYGKRYDLPPDAADNVTARTLRLAADCARIDCEDIANGVLATSLTLHTDRKRATQRLRAWAAVLSSVVRRLDEASAYEAGAGDALFGITPNELAMQQQMARMARKVAVGRPARLFDCGEHGMLTAEEIGLRVDRERGTVLRWLRDGKPIDEIMARASSPRRGTPRSQHSLRE